MFVQWPINKAKETTIILHLSFNISAKHITGRTPLKHDIKLDESRNTSTSYLFLANYVLFCFQPEFRVQVHPLRRSRGAIKSICCQRTANKSSPLYSQSLDIPTERHFLNLQYWHRFLLRRITRHLPSRKHLYSICFCMLLLKKPWKNYIHLGKVKRCLFSCLCVPRRSSFADEWPV